MSEPRLNVLFLCTGNSCRSQMAEGWCKFYHGNTINAFSAGTTTHGMNQRAVQTMKDAGVDISSQYSKTVEDLKDIKFDVVFTVCDDAHEHCPILPGTKIVHAGFDDPPRLTKHLTDETKILSVYQQVCRDIETFVKSLPQKI